MRTYGSSSAGSGRGNRRAEERNRLMELPYVLMVAGIEEIRAR